MKRHYSQNITDLLTLFPCVAILGVRQCGKTTLLNQLSHPWKVFDLEKGDDFEIISRDPDLFLRLNPDHIALDEAQLLPELFPALRVAIDANRGEMGRFIITGSSSPELSQSISESLAGRVAIIEMATFTLSEAYACKQPELYQHILNRSLLNNYSSLPQPETKLQQQHRYWLKGGYPEPWLKKSEKYLALWMKNYIQAYVGRDILQLFPNLNRQKYQLFLQMLAQLSGSIINYSQVSRTLGVSQPTAREYFNIAHGTFIWRHIPAYEKNAHKRVVKHPKGYLRDSGILHHLLHLNSVEDILSHPSMGHSWESMVIENILRELNILNASYDAYHYRTSAGAEVDLVLEGEFGLLPIEIKYRQKVTRKELRGLQGFIDEYKCPYGIVINNAERPVQYDEKIIAIPFGCI